eukprot:880500-Pleurochrysis_carterae.AAC.2
MLALTPPCGSGSGGSGDSGGEAVSPKFSVLTSIGRESNQRSQSDRNRSSVDSSNEKSAKGTRSRGKAAGTSMRSHLTRRR